MTVTIHFHGAAGTVTGSCYRVVHPHGQFLVDCGMFQGNRSVRDLNNKPLPFEAKAIDFLLLTHAHIDHCGLLPKLSKFGYRKPIWCTAPTAGLLEYLLRHKEQVVTRTMMLEGVWEYHFDPGTNVVDVHVSRLRRKVDDGFARPLVHTIRGAGYMLGTAD